jgi:hypothetical protein
LNAIQVRIDENVRMLAELHARWEREDEMARNMKVCTITTTSDVVSNASNPLTMCNFSETQKQQKIGNWHCGILLIG